MTRIFIENYEADLSAAFSTQITKQIDDIKNIDSKATGFTKTIIMPGTANNNNILGNIFDFNNSNFTDDLMANVKYNFNAAKTAKCRIDIDGMLAIKGVFRLLKIIVDGKHIEYEATIIGELGGLVFKLGAKKISDLDFSAYNHTYNITNITNSWANENAGAGYIYPLIDYGTYSTAKHDWRVGTFRPALFVKEYWEKIFTDAGYTYDFALLTTDRFKRLVVPHNQKTLQSLVSRILIASLTTSQTMLNSGGGTTTNKPNWTDRIGGGFSYASGVFTYTAATTVSGNIYFNIGGTRYSDTSGTFKISVRVNGTAIATTTEPTFAVSGIGYRWTDNAAISLSTGDTLDVYYEYLTGTNQTVTILESDFYLDTFPPTYQPVDYGQNVTLNDCIPNNVLQKDFVVSIMKLFNLYIDEDNYKDKHLVVKPYPDYYTTGSEDWSYKIDRSKPITVTPMSELNARYYLFKYKQDSDFYNDLYTKRYNENYGDRVYDSAFEFSNDKQELELIFAGTPLVGYAGQDKVYSTIFKRNGTGTIIEETIDSVIRILQCKKITGVSSYVIKSNDDATTLATKTEYLYAGHLNDPDAPSADLGFGVPKELFFVLATGDLTINQFNVYYSPYMAEITDKDSKLLECSIKLTDTDMYNLQFNKYKYIDGGLYRLVKIEDYTPGSNEIMKASFLKVIYTTY